MMVVVRGSSTMHSDILAMTERTGNHDGCSTMHQKHTQNEKKNLQIINVLCSVTRFYIPAVNKTSYTKSAYALRAAGYTVRGTVMLDPTERMSRQEPD